MAFVPTFQKQLDGSKTAGEDCVVRTASMGLDYATRGALVPKVADFRRRAGNLSTGLNTAQLEKAIESYDTRAETSGYEPMKCVRKVDGDWSDIEQSLRNNNWVCCWINYQWLNKNHPKLSGDPAYMGTHCVGALCIRYRDSKQWVRVWDPTYDGRRAEIPKGPQWWPLSVLKNACAATKDVGEFRGAIIPISKPLAWR